MSVVYLDNRFSISNGSLVVAYVLKICKINQNLNLGKLGKTIEKNWKFAKILKKLWERPGECAEIMKNLETLSNNLKF